MIRTLRRKFIISAMAAFGILLLLLVGGITISSYWRIETTADRLMEAALNPTPLREKEGMRQPLPEFSFGYRLGQPQGHIGRYTITAGADGEITDIQEKGIWEPDFEAAGDYARQILASGKQEGKLGSFKFRVQREADGTAYMVLMDNSLQIHMLGDVLRTASLLGLGCMAILFLILLPISDRAVRSYAANIEKQRQFITNAGHEIKTPVAIIMSNLDAMELIQGENKWSKNMRGQTERLSALLQRMLFLARIDEKSVQLPTEKIDITALVQAEAETYAEMIAEKCLRFGCELKTPMQLRGNRETLQQLVHVLMDNAVQYANPGGNILLWMEKKRRSIRILLENSVCTLPDCPPEALFDRFYRGDRARTQSGGGYGIGLSAARAIAEMHRGSIIAEYPDASTIRFTVEIPMKA